MPTRGVISVAATALVTVAVGVGEAAVPSRAVNQVRIVYRTVLTAEYFGPASGVCSHLSSAGVRSFTAGGGGSCTHAFDQDQHVLRHKTKGIDDSGYTAAQWRSEVNSVMSQLKVSVRGTHATAAAGESGIPGRTTLVKVGGKWLFNSYPPSLSS